MKPITFKFENGSMHPLGIGMAKRAADQWGDGEIVVLVPYQERSLSSHNHYFAAIQDAWDTLPEKYDGRWADIEAFRKWLLIKAGYYDQESIVVHSRAEALRVAAFVRKRDPYSVVTVNEATVTVFVAKSQSMKAMGKKDFQDSKEKTLDLVKDILEGRI